MLKGKSRILAYVLVMALAVTMLPTGTVAQAAKIKMNKKKVQLYVKQSTTLKVKGTKKKAKWSSSNKKVATVNAKGKVKAKKKGTCKITAKIGKKKYTCKVTVKNPVISAKKVTLAVGKNTTLKVTGAKVKSWSSSDKAVVSVNKSGKVTAKKVGSATITAKTGAGKLKCKVTVVKAVATPKPVIPSEKPVTPIQDMCSLEGMEFERNEDCDVIKVTLSGSVELSDDAFTVERFEIADTDFKNPIEEGVKAISADKDKKVYALNMSQRLTDATVIKVTVMSKLVDENKNSVAKVFYSDLSVGVYENASPLGIPIGTKFKAQVIYLDGAHITKENVTSCVSLQNLPTGISVEYKYNSRGYLSELSFTGTCTDTEKTNHKVVVTVTDPITKQQQTETVIVNIYDPNKITFVMKEEEASIFAGEDNTTLKMEILCGKVSDSSDYSLSVKSALKDGENFTDTEDIRLEYTTEEARRTLIWGLKSLQPGTYDFTIACRVSEYRDPDGEIEEQTFDFRLKVLTAYAFSGMVKDGEGNKLPVDTVSRLVFANTEMQKEFACTSTEEEGKFQIKLPEGKYKLLFRCNEYYGETFDLEQSVTVSKEQTSFDFTLSKLHRIAVSDLVNDSNTKGIWFRTYNEQNFEDCQDITSVGEEEISSAALYLVEGTYTIFADYEGDEGYYCKLLSIFTVGKNGALSFETNKTSGDLTYYVIGGKAWITSCNPDATAVTFPKKIDNYEVGGIVQDVLADVAVETLTMECELEQWYYGLANCTTLKKLILPDKVGEGILSELPNIKQLEEVSISENNKTLILYDGALYQKAGKGLLWCPPAKTTIQFLDGITQIQCNAFRNSSITKMTIPDTVTIIGDSAFANSKITEIIIPDTVTVIESSAFCNSKIKNITIPDSVTELGGYIFEGSSIETIQFPNNPKFHNLPSGLFADCSSLREVVIPEGITEMEWYLFNGASSLNKITLPASLTTIKSDVFGNCGLCNGAGEIVYRGTKEQWQQIEFEENSQNDLAGATIQCSDGTITVESTE